MLVDVVLGAWDVKTGETCETELEGGLVFRRGVRLLANRSVEILDATTLECLNMPEEKKRDVVLAAYLFPASENETTSAASAFAHAVRSKGTSPLEPDPLARCVNWPEPLKYVDLAGPKSLHLKVHSDETTGENYVELHSDVPVKGVVFSAEPDCEDGEADEEQVERARGVVFKDNCVDLVPRERLRIEVDGELGDVRVEMRFLGMD